MKNELYRHKKSDKVKWICTAVMFVLMVFTLVTLSLHVFGSGKVKPSEWFKKTEITKTEQETNETKNLMRTSLLSANADSGIPAQSEYGELKCFSDAQENMGGLGATVIYKPINYTTWRNSVSGNITSFDYEIKITYKYNCLLSGGKHKTFDPTFSFHNSSVSGSPTIFGLDIKMDLSDQKYYLYLYEGDDLTSKNMLESRRFLPFSPRSEETDLSPSLGTVMSDYIVLRFTNAAFYLMKEDYVTAERQELLRFDQGTETYSTFMNLLATSDKIGLFPSGLLGAMSGVTNGGHVYETAMFDSRIPIPMPEDPEKEGHTFAGWHYGTEDECNGNCTAYDGLPIYEDTALHAHFTINTYTVSYNVAGGDAVASITVNWNTAITPPTPTRMGYNFMGWYLADGTKYENQPIKMDTTLTAQWEIKTFTVTFYVNGEIYTTKTVTWGTHFSEIEKQATVQNMQVVSLRANNDGVLSSIANVGVVDDIDVDAQIMSGTDKVKNTVKNHWLAIALSAGGVVVLIVLISALCSRKKKAYRRR